MPRGKAKKREELEVTSPSKRSRRAPKKKEKFEENAEDEANRRIEHKRQCDKNGCQSITPICFVSASDRCVGSGYTSRWYHITSGEHYCNECFDYFYRSYRGGNEDYMEWKKVWSSNSRLEASLKSYMADQMLPFWAKCIKCQKWRQLSRKANIRTLVNYSCPPSKKGGSGCDVPEDSRVPMATDPYWLDMGSSPISSLLIGSPAATHLLKYYPDGVGLTPSRSPSEEPGPSDKLSSFVQAFYQPGEQRKAMCYRPDVMEKEERQLFPHLCRESQLYLGIRNTILALWNKNPKNWLTIDELRNHLICRGLSRIRCLHVASEVLDSMTLRGLVNIGLLTSPHGYSLLTHKKKVIVIGAGPSGLTAARHLQNLGLEVTLLEGRSRIGGRICDTFSLGGSCVGLGAQILTGLINNPLTTICRQGDFSLRIMGEKCDLYTEQGQVAQPDADQRVDFHFNAILDSVSEWRKNQLDDHNLYDKLLEIHETFCKETGYQFSKEEEFLLSFHLSNLEYACGSHLKSVSAIAWDQNESFPQFAGHHALLTKGYSQIISLLAQGLNIKLRKNVSSIDYSSEGEVYLKTVDGEVESCDSVLVTVPLAVLQKGAITFTPPLAQQKLEALKHLGAGIIEKVGLQFSRSFWSQKLNGCDFFGHVPSRKEDRGLFSIFYDLTNNNKEEKVKDDDDDDVEESYVLMTYLSGDAVKLLSEKSDREVVDICLRVLRSIFPKEEVPDPLNWFVSHWGEDPFAGMAYSYLKVGGTGKDYDILAQDIDQRLYFAGEATNREHPQTVTGAVLSGLREATKMAANYL